MIKHRKIIESLILSNFKTYINERCALLGFIPNHIPKDTF